MRETGTQGPGSVARKNPNGPGIRGPVLMMAAGESHKEASSRTTPCFLTPKQSMLVGAWNVRTLYQSGKLAQTINEMDKYQLDIMAVCESRWTGEGQKNLNSGHTIMYSGRNDGQHLNGVALILSKKAKATLLEWEPMGERLLRARLNSKYTKLTIIACYAPQEDKHEDDKDEFYYSLSSIIEKTPKHDMILILGDMNAKVGKNNREREQAMGREGLGTDINNNGERLVDFCEENNLIIGGTLFKHKDIHKYTWTSPDGKTRNQIDHILINKKWRTSLLDVRTRRGADVASDHELLVAKIRLKLRNAKKGETRSGKFNVQKLQNPEVAHKFKIELSNRFQVLQDDEEISLTKLNHEILEVSQQLLGQPRKKKEQWISEESWNIIEERKRTKNRLLASKSARIKENIRKEYKTLDKKVKASTKTDKKNYYNMLADTAEKASQVNDLKTLYQTTKVLCKKYDNNDVPIKDLDGKALASDEKKRKRWKEHFENILNREPPKLRTHIKPAENDLDINTGPPTIIEIKKAIRSLRSGKAAGNDQVTAEMVKAEDELTPKILHTIFKDIWEKEELPTEWSVGLIVKLPKKGDLSQCGNWRGIMLLSITSKIFSRIILDRMNPIVEPKLRKQQAGFRSGRSCSDHIFTLRQIFEQSSEWNASLYANFIDFEKAFDSVHRPALWNILRHYGIPSKMVDIIKMLYSSFHAKVICGNQLSDDLSINTGVKQGCILSPFLFCLAIDWILKESVDKKRTGLTWTLTEVLEDLDFADDIVLLSHTHKDMQSKTHTVQANAQKLGLVINAEKTKSMRINTKSNESIRLGHVDIEDVESFTYLGSRITKDGNSQNEIATRLSRARQTFGRLGHIWNSRKISQNTKVRLYKSLVLPVLLYGAESWKTTRTIYSKLDTFQNKCLRRILHIFWPNTISNVKLLEKTGLVPISSIVTQRRWRWIGHVLRMDTKELPKTALKWTPQGQRKRGRPVETWRRGLERDMKNLGWTWSKMTTLASDRKEWRSTVSALCAARHQEDKLSCC